MRFAEGVVVLATGIGGVYVELSRAGVVLGGVYGRVSVTVVSSREVWTRGVGRVFVG